MGVDLQEMNAWHVLFMARGTWFFNAAAYSFTHSPFGLLAPLFPFLFVAASGQLWRLLRPLPAWVRVLGVVLLFILAPSTTVLVDCVVGLAGVGLLCAMTRRLHHEPGTLLPLFCMSFWMVVSKQTGILSCFVFWACFSVVLLFREKWQAVPFLAKMAGGLLVAFCIVCASPYLTSWKHYGHPLYPAYTVDETRFPAHDITYDFRICNDDAKAMGHVGAFMYTYISPAVGRAYYNWKLGKTDFAPSRGTWWQNVKTANPTVPIPATTRWGFLFAFATVALLGGRRVRFYWIATAIALFCFPTAYLGYPRYTPWLAGISISGICYGCACVWKALRGKSLWKGVLAGCATLGVIIGVTFQDGPSLVTVALMIQGQEQLNDYLASPAFSTGTGKPQLGIQEGLQGLENLRLLCKQEPKLRNAEITILTKEEASRIPKSSGLYFYLPANSEEGETTNEYDAIQAISDRKARMLRYPLFILKPYTVTLPKLVWARVMSLFQ